MGVQHAFNTQPINIRLLQPRAEIADNKAEKDRAMPSLEGHARLSMQEGKRKLFLILNCLCTICPRSKPLLRERNGLSTKIMYL